MPERLPRARRFAARFPAARAVAVFVIGIGPLLANAQAPAPKVACGAPEYRQFDFWLGEWDVADASGKPVGRNRITAVQKGCALSEQWEGKGGVSGTSLSAWDDERRRWHQTWIDSTGGVLLLEGGIVEGRMVLAGTANDATGKPARQRITWQKLSDGRVRQTWESSVDDGATWTIAFDGYYKSRGRILHVPLL